MLAGKSASHVNQGIGKFFSPTEIKGYYNDLTEKVAIQPELLSNEEVPKVRTEKGEDIIFPVAVFQYGLGAYDLFLSTGNEKYLKKFNQCVKWTFENQESNGAWNNFFFYYPEHPYGSMAQGEGASLLLRAYKEYGDLKYLKAGERALDFMIKPIQDGGTAEYSNADIIMHEYTHREAVLNGWIFSLFGLFDYEIATCFDGKYHEVLEKSIDTLIKYTPCFTLSYWSGYDLKGRIASPFYHHLHIAQYKALGILTGKDVFEEYAQKWERQESNIICKFIAFFVKAIQKITEKNV